MNRCSYVHEKECNPLCCFCHTHKSCRGSRKAELPTAHLLSVADLVKVLGDPTRLRIMNAWAAEPELCVCDLSVALDMTQSAISHQLAVLRRARLVRPRKEGKIVYYSLDDNHIGSLLSLANEHVGERKG